MDTSETYIKMCERAEEIQDEWVPKMGDWVCSATHCLRNKKSRRNVRVVQYIEIKRHLPIIHSRESMGTMDAKYRVDVIWLPRQDQLQEMVNRPSLSWMLRDASNFEHDVEFDSMEQLWLAFVMKEKYNKIWNGSEWTVSMEAK